MARPPARPSAPEEAPQDFAAVSPRDPYPASVDYHFMLLEIGKLGTKVDRLIDDVKEQGGKIDSLRHQSTYIKGGIAVAVVAVGVVGWLLTMLFDNRFQAILTAVALAGGKVSAGS